MYNINENGLNPFIQTGFGVNDVMSFAMAPTSNQFLTGGLQDSSVDSGLHNFIPEIWGASVQDYMEIKLVYGNLANDLSAMVSGGGDLIHLPQHDELTASDLYGGDTAALQHDTQNVIAFDDTTTAGGVYQLTVNESAYAAFSVSDIAKSQSSYDIMNIYTQKLGYALAKKIDYYISKKLFTTLTHSDDANSQTDGALMQQTVNFTAAGSYNIDAAGVATMIQTIYENDSSLEDWTLVLAPATYASLFKLSDFARYDGSGNSFGGETPFISGYAGKLGGVNVVVSNNFVYVAAGGSSYTQGTAPVFNATTGETSEGDHLAGYLVHKDCIHIAYASGMKARVQSDYHLESLSTRFVADSVWGCTLVGNTGTNKRLFALKDA